MGYTQFSLKRSLLLSAVLAVSLLSGEAFAQGTTATGGTSQPTNTATQRTSPSPPPPPPPSSANTRTSTRTTNPASLPPLGQPTSQTTTTQRPAGALPGLPTLSKTLNTEIGTFPPPTVPPTANAPFMNHSTLPDGTVFIAVGAILGAFGVAIIAWRGIVACLLHRSVERAALAQHVANDKASSFPAPPAQFYKFLERDPSPISGAAAALGGALGGRSRKSHHGVPSVASASQTNLFFSPTAAPVGGAGLASASNRDSRFLPSGFYAAASPIPGHNAGTSISMSTLRPSSRGRPGVGVSPPGSPGFGPRRNMSSTSVDRPGSSGNGRAPSAFLDDLLDDQQGGPHPPMPHQNRYPSGPDGQYYTQSPSPPGHRGY
ncbi:vacuolar membrane protein [Podospora aff. communis PSN243]|uniref:Vacuolar membrane protein n=1 Tax=Podospora aff. communis PSN243 TaxID=3040156 RepID=A0AAV9H184_9PEZI|nr:vacuolar membrane protein [Podospora aff. communis PSN243]